jgi:hypothetical protein
MTIKGRPDLVMLSIESADGRGDPDSNLMCEVAFGRPTMQALYVYWLFSISVPKRASMMALSVPYFRHLYD